MSLTQRALLEALSRDELHQVAHALDVTVTDRRRKQGYIEALANARRISKQNLLAALPAASLRDLCQTFGKTPKGRAKNDYVEALSSVSAAAPVKQASAAKAPPTKKAVTAVKTPAKTPTSSAPKAAAKVKEAPKSSSQASSPQKAENKAAGASKATTAKSSAVKSAAPQKASQSNAGAAAPAAKAAPRTKTPAKAASAKAAATPATPAKTPKGASDEGASKPAATNEAPNKVASPAQAQEPTAAPAQKSSPAAKQHKATGKTAAKADAKAPSAQTPKEGSASAPAAKVASPSAKSGKTSSGKTATKKGSKSGVSGREKRARQASEAKADRGTPPRPAAIAPLIGVPRTKPASQKPVEPITLKDVHDDSAAPEPTPAPAPAAVQAQPPAAVRRGLVSWEEAVNAAQARGQSAKSMLGQPSKGDVHDLHQRCPKCKKRVEMQTCQSQLCQNRFVAAPGRRICAECMFERHNLSITDFNARLAEARQCPHCDKPLPERAAG